MCIECKDNKSVDRLGFCLDCKQDFFNEQARAVDIDSPANE